MKNIQFDLWLELCSEADSGTRPRIRSKLDLELGPELGPDVWFSLREEFYLEFRFRIGRDIGSEVDDI